MVHMQDYTSRLDCTPEYEIMMKKKASTLAMVVHILLREV